MSETKKSDSLIVASKAANKRPSGLAELLEQSGGTKGNSKSQSTYLTQCKDQVAQAANRVRIAAGRKSGKMTALLHHVSFDALLVAYLGLKRKASAGVDGVTWDEYGKDLIKNLERLHQGVHSGSYRGLPVKRVEIPKLDGGTRPLGIPALEDKIVQKAVVDGILSPIFEEHFLGYSYGYRPKKKAHDALDALAYGIERKKINYILDADIKSFFASVSRKHLVRFLWKVIGDKRVIRLVIKWLKGGVMKDGVRQDDTGKGTSQGSIASPILSNIYLHFVLDLWVNHWRENKATGDMIIVRYADDYVAGFQNKGDAERFLSELKLRMQEFSLELHPGKTRLIEFGRFAEASRRKLGLGNPETFNFLGFTHFCTKRRNGKFRLGRKPIQKKVTQKLRELKTALSKMVYKGDLWACGEWLGKVINGWLNYFAVPGSMQYLKRFIRHVNRVWMNAIRRRSQRSNFKWERLIRMTELLWPRITIRHEWPSARFAIRHNLR